MHDQHRHAGMSSEGFLDAASILPALGLESGMAFLDAGSGHMSGAGGDPRGNLRPTASVRAPFSM